MTARDRLSVPTVVVYWLVLAVGLGVYTAVSADDPLSVIPLWIGAFAGTTLGQCFALKDYRMWFVAVVLAGVAVWGGSLTPESRDGIRFWMAFVPATICGYASLSDRGALVAFWFPAVIWMLSILDRSAGMLEVDGSSAALLGGLAVTFVVFLRARETRRAGMWRTIAPTPIAAPTEAAILREQPRVQLGRTGWSLIVSGAAFVVTAWLAPRLWHVEPLTPTLFEAPAPAGNGVALGGLPCCPKEADIEVKRSRVREYFDLGRGRDAEARRIERERESCVVCNDDGTIAGVGHGPVVAVDGYRYDGYSTYGTYGGYGNYHGGTAPSGGDGTYGSSPGTGGAYADRYAAPEPTYTPPTEYASPTTYTPPPEYTPPTYTPPTEYTPPTYTPPEPEVTPPPSIPDPAPTYTAPAPTPPPPAPVVTAPPPPPTVAAPPSPPATPEPASGRVQRAAPAPDEGTPLVQWLVLLLAGALSFQLVLLGLRPLRRAITLRHLRKPFWDETVDQRISNSWHLVLVGLRDAGWRTTTGETPRELALRTNVDGVERCATILERARHGVGIDATDMGDMADSAEAAYRASRDTATPMARTLAWFRRPLA